jgi:hypothetical protein
MAEKFDVVVIGTGPSVLPWLKAGKFPDVPKYGCSWIPWHIKLNAYALGDSIHSPDVPQDGTRVVATKQCRSPEWELFDDERFPHGSQSGGMAITMACREFKRIAVIGFDGGLPGDADKELRELFEWWIQRGRTFVSLMPKSAFDDLWVKP